MSEVKDKVRCIECQEEIAHAARRCTHCDSYQDWRRHLQFSSTILALLVALISVLTVAVPVISDALANPQTDIRIRFLPVEQSEFIRLIIANAGERHGALLGGEVVFESNGTSQERWEVQIPPEDAVFAPGEFKRISYRTKTPIPLEQPTSPRGADCRINIKILRFDGTEVVRTRAYKCYIETAS